MIKLKNTILQELEEDVMNKELMLELFNKYMRVEINYPGSRMEQTDTVVSASILDKRAGVHPVFTNG